jgi:hypothetical protein
MRLGVGRMSDIELHRVDVMPDQESVTASIPRAMAFLLTRLLSQGQGLLYAEWDRVEPEVTWYVRKREPEREGEDLVLATLPAGLFSSMIARLAVTFDIDYTSSGCGMGTMLFEGRRFECHVFLSKCAASGYWIRVYAAAA